MKRTLALLLLAMIGCGSPAPRAVGNRAGLWSIQGNSVADVLQKTPGAVGQFQFPQGVGFVGYVLSDYVGVKPESITMTYQIDGNGTFDANWQDETATCYNPPSVTLIAQVQGDDFSGQDGRWWAGTQVLANNAGVITVSIPVDPALWTNVEGIPGTTRPDGFNHTFSNLGHVGFTFGGCSNYGHGVRLSSGSSTFTLESYEVK